MTRWFARCPPDPRNEDGAAATHALLKLLELVFREVDSRKMNSIVSCGSATKFPLGAVRRWSSIQTSVLLTGELWSLEQCGMLLDLQGACVAQTNDRPAGRI